ncbi:unnamed protein product, partial [Pleuronectes platessa]
MQQGVLVSCYRCCHVRESPFSGGKADSLAQWLAYFQWDWKVDHCRTTHARGPAKNSALKHASIGQNGERVNATDVSWEGRPEAGSRAADGSRSHGGQAGRWYSEMDEEDLTDQALVPMRSIGPDKVCAYAGEGPKEHQRPSLRPELSVFISLLPPHINTPQSVRKQSDPSVCCRLRRLPSPPHLSPSPYPVVKAVNAAIGGCSKHRLHRLGPSEDVAPE